MPVKQERVSPDVTDISSAAQLLSYATAGQVAQLQRLQPDLSQAKIAFGAGLGANPRYAGSILTNAIRKGPTDGQLGKLDEIIGALTPDVDRTGGLCSLALRLSVEQRHQITSSMIAHVPPCWTTKILRDSPADNVEVLIQASALLSAFMAAGKMDTAGRGVASVYVRYREELEQLARRLIHISVAPPTSRNYDAQMLLGSLASYAFEPMKDLLEAELRRSPLGFRVWRAITKLVKLNAASNHTEALKPWVRRLIGDSEELRKGSLYAGRGLDLELALTVPAAWSPPSDDWVGEALRKRARNSDATLRERGTAVMGLWQRAINENRPDLETTQSELREFITEFRNPETRPDVAAGLRWVAETLESVIDRRVAVCNEWPIVDEPWFRNVEEAASELENSEIPGRLLPGTKNLFRHMILQNAGVYRRQAIETVVTSGWSTPVARALGSLLRREQDEAWLRIRAEFALGFLQTLDTSVEDDLTRACLHAYNSLNLAELQDDMAPPRSHITEMHSSLFAVGDCFGVEDAEGRAKRVREALRNVLTDLAIMVGDRAKILRRPARAAAYLLIFTAQPKEGDETDLSQVLLEKLSKHPDDVTADLSRWALRFRFPPGGGVGSMLDAP
jgi:hypothetical protein